MNKTTFSTTYLPLPLIPSHKGRGNRTFYETIKNKESGFTLIELLIAMTIGLIILAALSSTFLMQRKTFDAQEQIVEMVQNARAAMDMMTGEIRMAGVGVPDLSWIDWVTISNPEIVQGVQGSPDSISIIGCFESPRATLRYPVSAGDTSLTLDQGDKETNKEFDTSDEKVIYIDGIENAIVTNVSGNILIIDTDPGAADNQGLSRDFVKDTPIYLVKVITYSIFKNTLRRNDNLGAGRRPLAENIEDLQISQTGNSIKVSITARTSKPDPDYSANNGYRTHTLTSVITPRNL